MSVGYVLKYGVLNAVESLTELEIDVLRVLKVGKQAPRNISKILGKSDSQVLHILRSLKDKGIVTWEGGEGRRVYYTIKEEYAWIGLAIECSDILSEYDNKVIKEILSDNMLNYEKKKLAIKQYFETREKGLKKLLQQSYEKTIHNLKATSVQ